MLSDDVSGLFGENPKGPALPAAFRQAVLTAFDADDGSNTVQIGPSTLAEPSTNLPMLVTGAEIGLESGDNILVMFLGNTPMIVGKIASVGGPNYGASNNGRAGVLQSSAGSSFGSTAAGTVVLTDTSVVVPGWARSVAVSMNGQATLNNNSGGLDNLQSQVKMHDPITGDHFSGHYPCAVPSTFEGSTTAVFDEVSAVTPGATLTFTYTIFSGTTWPARSDNIAGMTASLQFFREAAS
jgi:hypothetical protein